VTSSETLDAGTSGVVVAGAAGTIINNGQIAATHTSTDSVVAFVTDAYMSTITGTITDTVTLSVSGAYASPLTITPTGYVDVSGSGNAVYGPGGQAWTVVNQGRITAAGTTGDGVELIAGGFVSNSGLIEGGGFGVSVGGGVGTVSNFGTVEGTGTAAVGVFLEACGSVTNGSSGATAALIEGGESGVWILAGAGTVANFGTIEGSGTALGDYGVLVGSGGVTNGSAGSTAALIEGATGIILGAAGTVTNYGTVEGTSTIGWGVVLHNGGSVTNLGTIEGTGIAGFTGILLVAAGNVTNLGTIEGGVKFFDGGASLGGTYSVTNGASNSTAALIDGGDGGIRFANVAGTVTNFGTVVSTGVSADAIYFGYAGGSVTNLGTVESTGAASNGVHLTAGGTVTNGSSGSTAALISGGNYGIALGGIGATGSAGLVTNFGTVSGSVGVSVAIPATTRSLTPERSSVWAAPRWCSAAGTIFWWSIQAQFSLALSPISFRATRSISRG
jgi:hypothetical protein